MEGHAQSTTALAFGFKKTHEKSLDIIL